MSAWYGGRHAPAHHKTGGTVKLPQIKGSKAEARAKIVSTMTIRLTRGDIDAIREYIAMGHPQYPYPRIFLTVTNLLIDHAGEPDE